MAKLELIFAERTILVSQDKSRSLTGGDMNDSCALEPEGANPMKLALVAFTFGTCIGLAGAHAADSRFDSEAECRAISEMDGSGCRCRGLYYESKFGPEEGRAALHLSGRSYVPEPQVSPGELYERFGAATLDKVAQRILDTRDEAISFCPFSAHIAD
jgi:hypothetical protein